MVAGPCSGVCSLYSRLLRPWTVQSMYTPWATAVTPATHLPVPSPAGAAQTSPGPMHPPGRPPLRHLLKHGPHVRPLEDGGNTREGRGCRWQAFERRWQRKERQVFSHHPPQRAAAAPPPRTPRPPRPLLPPRPAQPPVPHLSTTRKGAFIVTKAVGTQGKGSVLPAAAAQKLPNSAPGMQRSAPTAAANSSFAYTKLPAEPAPEAPPTLAALRDMRCWVTHSVAIAHGSGTV